MASNLKGRLSRLWAGEKMRERVEAPQAAARGRPDFLESWDEAGEFVWTRNLSYPNPLPPSIDPEPFAPLRRNGRSSGCESLAASRIASERLRFFDLETTGLSGGAGTIAFLASIGKVEEDGFFSLSQVFLEDFPGEASFVGIVLGLLGEEPMVVSYNGKAFDLPLLRTRCVLTGNPPPSYAQVDALFAARRLWRRVHGGSSLGLIESGVLGIDRGADLPGAMIPEAWLSFARGEHNPLMRLVLSHNASDVVGLAKVVALIASIFEAPLSYAESGDIDRAGLGRTLLSVGREKEGEALLEAAARSGDEGAAVLLFRRLRLASRADEALALDALLPESYHAAVERAKLYERGGRSLEEAMRWANEAHARAVSESERSAARRRIDRLERKAKGR
jgi:hypothetical protein